MSQVTGAGLVLITLAGQKKGRSFTSGFVTDFKQESDILWFDQMLLLLAALCQVPPPRTTSHRQPPPHPSPLRPHNPPTHQS
jgi:hypothetical protein